jgi:hypothetical protein
MSARENPLRSGEDMSDDKIGAEERYSENGCKFIVLF